MKITAIYTHKYSGRFKLDRDISRVDCIYNGTLVVTPVLMQGNVTMIRALDKKSQVKYQH